MDIQYKPGTFTCSQGPTGSPADMCDQRGDLGRPGTWGPPGFAASRSSGKVHSLGPFLGTGTLYLLPVMSTPTSDPSTAGRPLGGVGGGGSFLCRPQAATPLPGCREGAWVPRSEETPLDRTLIVRSSCLGTLSPNKTPHLGEICGLQGEQLVGSLGGLWGPAGHGKVPRGPGCFWRRTLGISPGRVAPPCRRPALRSRGVLHLEAGRMGVGKGPPTTLRQTRCTIPVQQLGYQEAPRFYIGPH